MYEIVSSFSQNKKLPAVKNGVVGRMGNKTPIAPSPAERNPSNKKNSFINISPFSHNTNDEVLLLDDTTACVDHQNA